MLTYEQQKVRERYRQIARALYQKLNSTRLVAKELEQKGIKRSHEWVAKTLKRKPVHFN